MGYCEKDRAETMKKFEDEVRKEFQFLDYARLLLCLLKNAQDYVHYSLTSMKQVKTIKNVFKVQL